MILAGSGIVRVFNVFFSQRGSGRGHARSIRVVASLTSCPAARHGSVGSLDGPTRATAMAPSASFPEGGFAGGGGAVKTREPSHSSLTLYETAPRVSLCTPCSEHFHVMYHPTSGTTQRQAPRLEAIVITIAINSNSSSCNLGPPGVLVVARAERLPM